jgi:hypothetical protein
MVGAKYSRNRETSSFFWTISSVLDFLLSQNIWSTAIQQPSLGTGRCL